MDLPVLFFYISTFGSLALNLYNKLPKFIRLDCERKVSEVKMLDVGIGTNKNTNYT